MWSRLSREQRLWVGVGALVVSYFVLAATGQRLLVALQGRGLLRIVVGIAVLLGGAIVLISALRRRLNVRQYAVVAVLGAIFFALLRSLEIVQERLHLLQYALLAAVLEAALRERWRERSPRLWRRPGAVAVLLSSLVGWADEGIQALTPNRYYDLRDVFLNAIGGALLIVGLVLVRRLEAGSPRSSRPPGD